MTDLTSDGLYETPSVAVVAPQPLSPGERLRNIRESLDAGEQPPSATVRELLLWFDAYRRGYKVMHRIREALTKAGLITVPDFDSAFIDAPVSFTLADANPAPLVGTIAGTLGLTGTATGTAIGTASISVAIPDPTYRIGRLAAANKTLVTVGPDAPLTTAITLMLAHDFSQLPVTVGERTVRGIVSWQSIGARWALGKESDVVRNFLDDAPEISADRSLFSAIPIIIERGFILVRGATQKIDGIVTATDLTEQFRQLAEPFLLVGEIENHVRKLLDGKFTSEELTAVKEENDPRPIETVADLTFGQYVRLLQEPGRWSKVGLAIDRATFTAQLDEVRDIRNDIMHFDPDPMEESRLKTLRRFSRFLQTLQALRA